jgi:hypothetical protein
MASGRTRRTVIMWYSYGEVEGEGHPWPVEHRGLDRVGGCGDAALGACEPWFQVSLVPEPGSFLGCRAWHGESLLSVRLLRALG